MGIKDIDVSGKCLPIREFQLKWLVEDPTIVLIAKRGSGKSWVCRSLLMYFNSIGMPGGVIIAPTDNMTKFYGNFFPESYVHYEYSSEILDKIFYRQNKMIKKKEQKKLRGKKINPKCFLLMDDCLADNSVWKKDKNISTIFCNGRHYQITFMLTMQYPLGIGPTLRTNIDYTFLLHDDLWSNQKRIYDNYAGIFPTFDFFRQVFKDLTKEHGCMVICNRGGESELLEKVFWFKAKKEDGNMIGSKQFIKFHSLNYNKNWEEEGNNHVNINDYVKKRNAPTVHVARIDKDK